MTVTDDEERAPGPPPAAPARPARNRLGRRRAAPVAPAARFEPGRIADARHRNPTWVVAGVLLVVLSALGGVLLFTSSDERAAVLVAATDLAPGAAVTAADLRIERVGVDDAVRTIPATAAGTLVGQHTTGRVPAGTLLAPAMFALDVPLGPDEVVVGASLDPGEAPLALLEVGASVELLDVAVAAPGAPAAEVATPLGTGTVWAVEPVATGQLWLSVRVERAVGLAVSVAAAADRLRVVLVGAGG
jgi:hypothetical protein